MGKGIRKSQSLQGSFSQSGPKTLLKVLEILTISVSSNVEKRCEAVRGSKTYYLQHYLCSGRMARPRAEVKKGLTRIGTLFTIVSAPVPAFPYVM